MLGGPKKICVLELLPVVLDGETVLRLREIAEVFPSKTAVTTGPVVLTKEGWKTFKTVMSHISYKNSLKKLATARFSGRFCEGTVSYFKAN